MIGGWVWLSYPSAEMQLAYSTTWAKYQEILRKRVKDKFKRLDLGVCQRKALCRSDGRAGEVFNQASPQAKKSMNSNLTKSLFFSSLIDGPNELLLDFWGRILMGISCLQIASKYSQTFLS